MSGIFEGLLARLQIAKASLATCSPERLHKISALQSAAVVEHLRALKTSKMFKSEHKANIMDATINIKFCSEHSDAILAELEDNPIHARRKGQDFTAWTAFCSAPEWVAIMSDQHDDATVINCIVEIIMVRLQCRNASEDTKKSIANVVLAKVCKTMDDVYCIPSWRKESIKRAVHKRIEQRKRKSAQPSLYLAALPCEPAVLRSEHPEFFVKVAPLCGFAKCPIDTAILAAIDSSYNARGQRIDAGANQLAVMPRGVASTPMGEMAGQPMMLMQMMQMCFRAMGGGGGGGGGLGAGGGDCPLTFATAQNCGRKRSLSSLAEGEGAQDALASRCAARARFGVPITFGVGGGRAAEPLGDGSPPLGDDSPPREFSVDHGAAPASAMPAASVVPVPDAETSSAALTATAGIVIEAQAERKSAKEGATTLLEAIVAKAAQSKLDASVKRRLAGKQAAEDSPAAKVPTLPVTATPTKALAVKAPAAKAVKAKAPAENTPGLMGFVVPDGAIRLDGVKGIPNISHEGSRSQIQCRSGFSGVKGVNMAIKYGAGTEFNYAKATAIAEKWVKDAKKKWGSSA